MAFRVLLLLLSILCCVSGPLSAQNCGSRDTILTQVNGSSDYILNINNLVNNDLSSPGQGLCGVELTLAHQYIYDVVITLFSPAGESVVLIGPDNSQSRPPSIFARWFIDFNQCTSPAMPDPGAPAVWNNNFPFNWAVGGVYTGTYHPNNGCLEDFDTGPVNGQWRLQIESNKPGASGAVIFFRLVFCDETGFDCCFADAGTITEGELIRCEAHPDLARLILPPFYNQPRPDTNEYDYTYLIGEGGAYFGIDSTLDFTGYAPGDYEICGFSYRRGELGNLPTPDGIFSIQDLRNDLASLTPTLCGDLSPSCYRVSILPQPDTTFITTAICTGDEYTVGSTTYNSTGLFVNDLVGQGLCDSVVILDLSVVDELVTNIDTTVCFGASVAIANSVYTQTGNYSDTLTSSFGCDSIIFSNITIRDEDLATSSVAICIGDTVYVGGEAFFNSIVTQRTLTNRFGCDSTVTLDLVVLNPQIVIAPIAPLDCNNDSITLDASPSLTQQSTNFRWFNLSGNQLGTGASLTTDTAGTYIVELTESFRGSSCNVRDTIEIANLRALPTIDLPLPDTLSCSRLSVALGGSLTSAGSNFIHQWTGPSGAIFNQPTNQPTTAVATPGNYQLLVINTQTGCRDSMGLTVEIDTLHPQAILNGDSILNCAIDSQLLWADSNQLRADELIYEWSTVSNCLPSPVTGSQITAVCPDNYRLTVINQVNGCSSSVDQEVTANRVAPTPDIAAVEALTCYDTVRTLNGRGSSPSGQLSYQWTDNSNNVISIVDTVDVNQAGNYQLLVLDNSNQCVDSVSIAVIANQAPPTVDIGADTFMLNCLTPSVTVGGPNSSSGPNFSYAWTEFAADLDTLGTNSTLTINDRGGIFVLSILNTDNGCVNRDSSRVLLRRDTPFVRIQEPIPFGCFTDSVALDATSTFLGFDHQLDWSGGPCLPDETDSTLIYVNCVGTYQLTVTNLENGCVGDSTVFVGQEPNAVIAVLADSAFIDCTTGSVRIDPTNSTLTNSRRWLRDGEPVVLFGDMPEITVPGTYTYIISNFDGSCVDSASIEVVADCPILSVIIPPDSLTCRNGSILLDAGPSIPLDPTGVTVEWLFTNPGCVFPGANDRQIVVACPGEYGFVISNALDGNVDTSYVTVVQDLIQPIADAGINDTINCYTPSVELNGTASQQDPRFSYAWTNAGDDTVSVNQLTMVNQPGIYLFRVLNEETGCSATDVVTIFRDVATPDLDFTNTFIPCREDSFALSVITDPELGNYGYSWSGPLIQDNRDSATVIIGQEGTYTATVTNLDNGCPTADDVFLEQLPCPPCLVLSDTAFTCVNDVIMLETSFCEPCVGCSFRWFRDGMEIIGETNSTLAVTEVGVYELRSVNTFGLSSSISVNVGDLRILPEQAAGPDRFLTCDSSSVRLGREIIDTVFGFTYQWIDEDGNDIPGATSNFLTVNQTGIFGLRSSNAVSQCSSIDTVIVGYDTLPPIANAGPNVELTCDDPLNVLNGQNSSTGSAITYEWTGGPSATCLEGDNTLSPIVACGGTYYLYVRDNRNGCISRDTVVVTASDALPQIIPLGDTVFNCYADQILLDPFIDDPTFTTQWCQLDALGDSIPGSCVLGPQNLATSPATYQFSITNEVTGCTNGFSLEIGEDFREPFVFTNPSDTFYCTLDSLALIGGGTTQSGANAILNWTSFTGFTIGNSDQDTAYAYQPDRYFLTITDPVNGCTAIDSIDFLQDITAPNADAGIDSTLNCQRRELRLTGIGSTFSGQIQYNWASMNGGNIVADANAANPLIDRAGSYLFSVTDPVNSCTTQDIVVITEDTIPPVASFTADTRLLINCYLPTTVLDASSSISSNGHPLVYNWRSQGVGTPIEGESSNMATIDLAGSYQLLIQDEVNRCRDTLSVSVTSDFVQPNVSVAPPEIINCSRPEITLVSTPQADGSNYIYSWLRLPSNVLLGTASDQLVNQSGDYLLNIIDTLNGCLQQITTSVGADLELPDIQLNRMGVLNCESPFVSIDAEGSSIGTNFSSSWSSANGTFETTNSPYRIRAMEGGSYVFTLVNADNGCENMDSIVIDRDARFIDVLDLEVINAQCESDLSGSVMVMGVEGGTPPYRFQVDGGLLTDRLVYDDLPIGTYELTVVDSSGCERSETFTIQSGSPVEVSLGPDQTINLGDSIALTFSSNRAVWDTLIWRGDGPLPDPNALLPYVSPLEGTRYTLSMIDTSGCIGTDDIRIEVLDNLALYVPNTFSPNGDNTNDLFFPFAGPQIKTIHSFMIFDRWGNMVHEALNFEPNNPVFGWDGTLDGKPLNTNVFVWKLQLELHSGEMLYRAGDVLLQR